MVKFAKVALVTVAFLVGFDLVGVISSLFFDAAPIRGTSPPLFFAIWFVLGAFAGFLSYNAGGKVVSRGTEGDWSNRTDAKQAGLMVLVAIAAVVIGLTAIFFAVMWKQGSAADVYVPDNEALSITFFAAVIGAAAISQFFLLPTPGPTTSEPQGRP